MRPTLPLILASLFATSLAHAAPNLTQAFTQFNGAWKLSAKSDSKKCGPGLIFEVQATDRHLTYSISRFMGSVTGTYSFDDADWAKHTYVEWSNTQYRWIYTPKVSYGLIKHTEQPYIQISCHGGDLTLTNRDEFSGETAGYMTDKDRFAISADGKTLTHTSHFRSFGFMTYSDTGPSHVFEHKNDLSTCIYEKFNAL